MPSGRRDETTAQLPNGDLQLQPRAGMSDPIPQLIAIAQFLARQAARDAVANRRNSALEDGDLKDDLEA